MSVIILTMIPSVVSHDIRNHFGMRIFSWISLRFLLFIVVFVLLIIFLSSPAIIIDWRSYIWARNILSISSMVKSVLLWQIHSHRMCDIWFWNIIGIITMFILLLEMIHSDRMSDIRVWNIICIRFMFILHSHRITIM